MIIKKIVVGVQHVLQSVRDRLLAVSYTHLEKDCTEVGLAEKSKPTEGTEVREQQIGI